MFFFFFQAEDGIRDTSVTGVQTCALPILTEAREKLLKEYPDADLREAPGDLSTEEGTASVIEAAPEADIVVHNAGIYGLRSEERRVGKEWRSGCRQAYDKKKRKRETHTRR